MVNQNYQEQLSDIMEAVFNQKKEMGMSTAEYNVFMASQIANNPHWNRAKPLPVITGDILSYSRERIAGTAERNAMKHERLAMFFKDLIETNHENKIRLGQWHWALEKLEPVSLGTHLATVKRELENFVIPSLDEEIYKTLIGAFLKDSRDLSKD